MSLRDIAQEAGVSVSTVSRVLSGSKNNAKISDETRERIIRICEERRFHPNIHYRRLHEGLSRVIGLLIPPPSPELMFFDENVGSFLSAIEPALAEHGFSIMIQSLTTSFTESRRHLEIFRSHAVDAAILWDVLLDDAIVEAMLQEHKPLVCAGFPSQVVNDQVLPDNRQGTRDLTKHLLSLGHRDIVYIAGGNCQVDRDRLAGYHDAMSAAGAQPRTCQGSFKLETGYEITAQILQEHSSVTAIMAANDLNAAGCLRRLMEMGMRVPEDISVTGFDGTTHSRITTPRLTTVSLELARIGAVTADRIVQAVLQPADYKPQITRIKMEPQIRESTGPVPVRNRRKTSKKQSAA